MWFFFQNKEFTNTLPPNFYFFFLKMLSSFAYIVLWIYVLVSLFFMFNPSSAI